MSETLTDQTTEQTAVPFSLPASYYTDPEIYKLEMERIFYRAWNFAGYTSQLRNPGDYVTCKVGEESIIVVQGQDQGCTPSTTSVVIAVIGCWRGRAMLAPSPALITRGLTRPAGSCDMPARVSRSRVSTRVTSV